jgi:hypothetical protein
MIPSNIGDHDTSSCNEAYMDLCLPLLNSFIIREQVWVDAKPPKREYVYLYAYVFMYLHYKSKVCLIHLYKFLWIQNPSNLLSELLYE